MLGFRIKRRFSFYSLFFAFFSFLSITFGNRFSVIALCALFFLFVAILLLRIFTENANINPIIIATMFSIVATILVLAIHLPRIDEASRFNEVYITSEGSIISSKTSGDFTLLTVKCRDINGEKVSQKISVIIRDKGESGAEVGKRISFCGDAEFQSSSYSKGNEIFLNVFSHRYEVKESNNLFGKFISFTRGRIREIADTMDNGPLVKALMIGDKSELSDEFQDKFRLIGTSHVLAISGLHLSIIVMSFYIFLVNVGASHRVSAIFSSLLSLLYISITGFQLSLIRAAEMLLVFFFARFARRNKDGVTSLMFSGFCIILVSPWSLYNSSFQLSFLATLGILTFAPVVTESYLKHRADKQEQKPKIRRGEFIRQKIIISLLSSTSSTLSATLMTLPVTVLLYNEISSFSIIGNVLTVPLVKYFLLFSFVSVVTQMMCIPILYYPFNFISKILGRVFVSLTSALGSVATPLVSLETAYFYVGVIVLAVLVIIFFCFHKKHWSLPVLALAVCVFIFGFNFSSKILIYPTALVDTINKSGANTTVIKWRGETYILDQTDSNSSRIYSLLNMGITDVDQAVFIATKEVPVERIELFISLFNIDTITLVSLGLDTYEIYEVWAICKDNNVELNNFIAYEKEIAKGITAYCYDDVCTAFLIENGENDLCIYRSLSEQRCLPFAYNSDYLVFDGNEKYRPSEATTATSFRLHN